MSVIIVIMMSACSKNNITPVAIGQKDSVILCFKDGKEDEDGPIIMHKVIGKEALPVRGALVLLFNDADTVSAVSDLQGNSIIKLPYAGSWMIEILHDDYELFSAQLDAYELIVERVDTLSAN